MPHTRRHSLTQGAAAVYPSRWTVANDLFTHVRGAAIAAALCVYVAYAPWLGVAGVAEWLRAGPIASARDLTIGQILDFEIFRNRAEGKTLEGALLFAALTAVVQVGLYILVGGFYAICDFTGLFSQYKLPRSPRMRVRLSLILRTLSEAVVNHLIAEPLLAFVLYTYAADFRPLIARTDGFNAVYLGPVPNYAMAFLHILAATFVNDILVYSVHRGLHANDWLYRRIHKQHHQYVGSIAPAGDYMHVLERAFEAQLPAAAYFVVASNFTPIPQPLWFTWFAVRVWQNYEAHSGYAFRGTALAWLGLTSPERAAFHDWHHSENRGNYGVYWLDYVFGTMDSYARFLAAGGYVQPSPSLLSPGSADKPPS